MSRNKRRVSCIISLAVIFAASLTPLTAARKTIYLKPFAVVQGLPAADPAGSLMKDYISEEIIAAGQFTITSDDEVRQVIAAEELKMSLDACYDDACIKKLMESIKTDYIIYGNVSFLDGKFYITAKILDRTSGNIVLARVKTLKFRMRDSMGRCAQALGAFLVDGREDSIREFEQWIAEHETDQAEPVRVIGRKDNILTRASLFRLGYGFSTIADKEVSNLYDSPLANIVLDGFLWRERDRNGNGLDVYMRGTIHMTNWNHDKLAAYKDLNPNIPVTATAPDDDSATLGFLGIGPGVRYIYGSYFKGIQCQGYILAAYQLTLLVSGSQMDYKDGSSVKSAANDIDKTSPKGVVGGVGLEVSFSPAIGAFVELAYGYNQVKAWGKTRNLDGRSVFFGLTLRSSYL
ncbi:MAG: hypothetical protein EPN93_11040 [Spirochaetes bacterium]|nr:MAG: hypothetical protein EPN93_11040 [Spirochaetota bacterium]